MTTATKSKSISRANRLAKNKATAKRVRLQIGRQVLFAPHRNAHSKESYLVGIIQKIVKNIKGTRFAIIDVDGHRFSKKMNSLRLA